MDICLSKLWEFVMDREAWRAVIHRVTKSRTRRSNWVTELKWTELNWTDTVKDFGIINKAEVDFFFGIIFLFW